MGQHRDSDGGVLAEAGFRRLLGLASQYRDVVGLRSAEFDLHTTEPVDGFISIQVALGLEALSLVQREHVPVVKAYSILSFDTMHGLLRIFSTSAAVISRCNPLAVASLLEIFCDTTHLYDCGQSGPPSIKYATEGNPPAPSSKINLNRPFSDADLKQICVRPVAASPRVIFSDVFATFSSASRIGSACRKSTPAITKFAALGFSLLSGEHGSSCLTSLSSDHQSELSSIWLEPDPVHAMSVRASTNTRPLKYF